MNRNALSEMAARSYLFLWFFPKSSQPFLSITGLLIQRYNPVIVDLTLLRLKNKHRCLVFYESTIFRERHTIQQQEISVFTFRCGKCRLLITNDLRAPWSKYGPGNRKESWYKNKARKMMKNLHFSCFLAFVRSCERSPETSAWPMNGGEYHVGYRWRRGGPGGDVQLFFLQISCIVF
jgi:hypothetical protein